jgi:hypothetical protein
MNIVFYFLFLSMTWSFQILNLGNTRRNSHLLSSSLSDEFNWDPNIAPKLDFDECYYEVLEIPPFSSLDLIKKSFYRLGMYCISVPSSTCNYI